MMKVQANKSLFIKLGPGGLWEKECIEDGILKLGYIEADFNSCQTGDWIKIEKQYLNLGKSKNATSGFITQIKYFFEEPDNTLWVTFYNNKLWWTRAKKDISLCNDGTKVRSVIDSWSDKDIFGNTLFMENLSGKLLKTQGFRGTICAIGEHEYLIRKINGEMSESVKQTKLNYDSLKFELAALIKELTWQDFEVLIDLIFAKAGWQRVSSVGKTAKTLDLDLKAPVTGEKCLVQIKSTSNQKEFNEYSETFASMDQYDKIYYVCHSFTEKISNETENSRVKVMLVEEVAELAIDSGLSKWIISKSS